MLSLPKLLQPYTLEMPHPQTVPQILVRSSWQTVNIGDIGHTFGLLCLLQKHLPEAGVTLWPVSIDRGVRQQLQQAFPELEIAEGNLNEDGQADTLELKDAIEACDVLLHGSGPYVVAWNDLEVWRRSVHKPYVICGVTIDPTMGPETGDWEGGDLDLLLKRIKNLPIGYMPEKLRLILNGAEAVFCRDSHSLKYVQRELPELLAAMGPDATFGCTIMDEDKAQAYLRSHELEKRRFICVIPRLRWTPYYEMEGIAPNESDLAKRAVNLRTQSSDHKCLREVIVRWVRQTGMKVLVCPEMTYQVALAKEELFDPLPEDVKPSVVWRGSYWLNDEASAVYAYAHTLVSLENHSPIFALAQGTPAIYVRQPTDTVKGQMWLDVGMDEWFFEVDAATGDSLWEGLRKIYDDYPNALGQVDRINTNVARSQQNMLDLIHNLLKMKTSKLAV